MNEWHISRSSRRCCLQCSEENGRFANCTRIFIITHNIYWAQSCNTIILDLGLTRKTVCEVLYKYALKLLSKLIRILRITLCYKQLCSRCLVNMTTVDNMVIHCVFALLSAKYISGYYNV